MTALPEPHDLLPQPVADDLRRRYGAPHRRYHDLAHARQVVAHATDLAGSRACLIAAWFHDAVYEPSAADNEERSARLLEATLPDDAATAEAARLVRLTATHDPAANDVQGQILTDADLAILGAQPDTYDRYAAAVRAEYGHVPEDAWREGRAAVLRRFLERPWIYHTAEGRARWEVRARDNVHRELARLTRE